jgi:hypothetical protein
MNAVPTREKTIKQARETRERARQIAEIAREMRRRAQEALEQIRMNDRWASRRRSS